MVQRFPSVDPIAEKYTAWSPFNYVMGNPINSIDPDGRFTLTGQAAQDAFRQIQQNYGNKESNNDWIPVIDEETGSLYLQAEAGDTYASLIDYFGGLDNASRFVGSPEAAKYLSGIDAEVGEGQYVQLSGTFADAISQYYTVFNKNFDASNLDIMTNNPQCHATALCGTRDQSLVNFGPETNLQDISEAERDRIVSEQYEPISSFRHEGEVGSSILVFPGHTATYFGTSNKKTQYFLSKDNRGGFLIENRWQVNSWGANSKAYNIKSNFKKTPLPLVID